MKQYIITVDGGTTNTRCILWDENRRRIAQENRPVGVRNTAIDGNNRKLKQAVKECLGYPSDHRQRHDHVGRGDRGGSPSDGPGRA